jgi:hypothetical protein
LFALPSLGYLDLHNNHFIGNISEFQHNSFEYFDLSNNHLHGPVPSSIFKLYLLAQRLAAKMSILEISTAVFPMLTLVWKYLQVNLQFHIQQHMKSGQYLYIQVPKTWRSRTDQMKIGSPSLMLKEKDLLGRPIPQNLECKNLQTPISIVCQFSSNSSTKLLPERVLPLVKTDPGSVIR